MRNHLRDAERTVALQALEHEGSEAAAYEAILTAIRCSPSDSLDRYLLFNIAMWMLENWQVPNTETLHRHLLEIMKKMRQIQAQLQPEKKQPAVESGKPRKIRKVGS